MATSTPIVEIAPARFVRDCAGCASAEQYARVLGQPERWVRCLDCGAEWHVPAREKQPGVAAPKPKRVSRAPTDDERRLRQALHELLAWHAGVERVERNAMGGGNANATIERIGALGITGDGCSGTKGTGKAPAPDRPDAHVDLVAQGRYDALTGDAKRCADEVCADGQGDAIVDLSFGPEGRTRVVPCSLAVRIGLRLSPPKQALKYFAKLATGDSPPALAGATAIGERALKALANAWFGTVAEGSTVERAEKGELERK